MQLEEKKRTGKESQRRCMMCWNRKRLAASVMKPTNIDVNTKQLLYQIPRVVPFLLFSWLFPFLFLAAFHCSSTCSLLITSKDHRRLAFFTSMLTVHFPWYQYQFNLDQLLQIQLIFLFVLTSSVRSNYVKIRIIIIISIKHCINFLNTKRGK